MISAAPAGCSLSAGSYAALQQRLARRIARWMARCVRRLPRRRMLRDGPGSLPDGSLVYRFGGWCRSRRTRRLARRFAHGASADGSMNARRRARQLAYIVSIRDGPGGLPDGSLVLLRQICASTDGSIRDGPGGWPGNPVCGDGSLDDYVTGKIR